MAVDERERHQLYNRAVEVLGEEEADILMAHLPPGGYPNLATKQDILDLRAWATEREAGLEGRLKAHTWKVATTMTLAIMGAFAAISFAAA